MFGDSTPVEKPVSPPSTPTSADASVVAAGQRAISSARIANKSPSTSLIGFASGSSKTKLQRKATTAGRTLIGGV